MCLFMKNVKLDISNNGSKDISNGIMGINMFPSIGTSQKVYPHQSLWGHHKCNELNPLAIGWRRPNLVQNVAKIISKGIQNDGMIGYAKNHALEPRSMHDLKQMQ